MKRIIFDLDDTLIYWEDKYNKYLEEGILKINSNLTKEDAMKISLVFDIYETKYDKYDKNILLELIQKDVNIKDKDLDKILDLIGDCAPDKMDNIIETLEYLSSKYEIYLLTNFFVEVQTKRLKKAGLYKYFNKCIGADQVKLKPNIESFEEACKGLKMDECLMIGDSIRCDIEGSINVGMNAILISKNDNNQYKTIKEIKELEYLL